MSAVDGNDRLSDTPVTAPDRIDAATRLAVLEVLVATSDDAVLSHDPAGLVTSWNRSAERIFGYREDEMSGHPTIMLFPDHLQAELEVVFGTVVAGDRVSHFETEIRRKDGMPVPISLSVSPVLDREHGLLGAVLVARDITEQRLGQATLAEVETLMRETEALAHVGTWLWDVASGVVQWSDELHRMHRVDPLDFEGTLEAHLELVHPEDADALRSAMRDAVASRRPFDDEYRVARADGELRWFSTRGEPTIGSDGTVVGLRGTVEDVTDRHAPHRDLGSPGETVETPARI